MFLLAECPLPAQYSGQRGPGIPWPRRGKQQQKGPSEAQATVSITGVLRSVDAREMIVEAQDTRIINLKRTEKTKFYKDSAEAKAEDFKPGDHVAIQATQDEEGYFYAVDVTWQKPGTPAERTRASEPVETSVQKAPEEEGPPVQRRAGATPKDSAKDKPKEGEVAETTEPGPPPTLVRDAPPPVKIGADDPGPPVQRHGGTARRATTTIEPPTEAEVARAEAAAPPKPAEPPPPPPKPEPVIDKARLAAASFDEKLPNYICQQFTARFQSTSHPVDWRPIDILSAEVIYEAGRERYRNIQINGKKTIKSMEESGGAWSTGEYGSILADLFSPSTAAEFRPRANDSIGGVQTVVYDFSVEQTRSHWTVHAPAQLVRPAYRGSVWIDQRNGRVMRIEMQARRMPKEFPFDTIESTVEYQYVRLGGPDEFLLPVHGEVLSCQRGTNYCSRNAIDFRNYHKFTGEASITYGP